MRTLTQREKRTVRLGAIALGIYLLVYCGVQVWNALAKRHTEYQQLLAETQNLRRKVALYQTKVQHIQKLMDGFHMDPAKLSRASVLAQASAAIQSAAQGGGVQIGPVRESPGRPSTKELGSIQLEAVGPAPALLKFIQQTHSLGYPVIIDSMQIGSEPTRPGPLKLNLTITVLDFDQWKQETPHV
jgi:hypothetical protein